MRKQEEIKGLIDDLRNASDATLSKESCLTLSTIMEEQQREIQQLKDVYQDRVDDVDFFMKQLREIDTHIRSDKKPVPYIIETLKGCLPEYN